MDKFDTHTGVAVPLRRSNVDTDQIIPAVYLKRVTRTGFEDALFAVRTAKEAGFRVAAVYDPDSEKDREEIKSLADYYITSFEELYETQTLG